MGTNRVISFLATLWFCTASASLTAIRSKQIEMNWQDLQKQRLSDLSRGCEALKRSGEYFKSYRIIFFLDSAKSVAFCPVPKTASSWWLTTFLRENGINKEGMEKVRANWSFLNCQIIFAHRIS